MFCTNCGEKLSENDRFCTECGEANHMLQARQDQNRSALQPSQRQQVQTGQASLPPKVGPNGVQHQAPPVRPASVGPSTILQASSRKRLSLRLVSMVSGIILLCYALGYVLPWFEGGVTGLDVIGGLHEANAFVSELSGFFGIGGSIAGSIARLYYTMIATIVLSIIFGIFSLVARSKISVVCVFIVSLIDIYFLFSIMDNISSIARYMPSGIRYPDPGIGIIVLVLAAIVAAILSFIGLFLPSTKRN